MLVTLPFPTGEHGSPWDASIFPSLDATCGGDRALDALLRDDRAASRRFESPVARAGFGRSTRARAGKLAAWFLMDHFSTASTKRVRDSGTWVLDHRIRQVPMGLSGASVRPSGSALPGAPGTRASAP